MYNFQDSYMKGFTFKIILNDYNLRWNEKSNSSKFDEIDDFDGLEDFNYSDNFADFDEFEDFNYLI